MSIDMRLTPGECKVLPKFNKIINDAFEEIGGIKKGTQVHFL